ncbi:uncharacterized protein LOC124496793 [Dermatophagoides farinae]|uniref:uncharacterized protein LOC124496793 n=1 Tax=Dermatophagoides farinae TaxID=6954 RepID=UPI003F603AB4
MKLNKTKISSVSTTSLCSEKESSSSQSSNIHHHHQQQQQQQNHYNHNHFHDSNPATMLLPNTTATAFRSFIKTKSTGIMIRKDHSDDDDEEVEKLCDSECSKLSNECCSTPNTADDTDDRHPEFSTTTKTNVIVNSSSNDNSDLVHDQSQNRSSSDHSHDSFAIHSIDTNQSFISSELYEQQTETGSISSSTFITTSGGNNNQQHQQQQQQKQQQLQKSGAKRHHHIRTNPILPILKSNRFVKHSKASNILFTNKTQKNQMKKRTSSESGTSSSLYSTTSQELVRSLRSDRMILTQPDEDRRRRTIIIEKQKNTFGFTLQTYGIKIGQEIELITYVDEVSYGGPAFRGGMRPGDVILSINGRDVERADHQTLVNYINSCEKTMRLVVLFEDCVRKIELHLEFIKLQKSLQQKLTQLEILNQREDQILLNAALRNCTSNENNNNNTNENFVGQLQMKKKFASKSLNVSLNDLDDCRYDIDDDDDDDDDDILVDDRIRPPNDYSTSTFPRKSSHIIYVNNSNNNNNNNQTNIRIGKDEEENEILIDDDDDNRTSNNNDADDDDKRNGNNNNSDQIIVQNDSNDCKQSISLPQSVHNSLDCLTNEAYEDDENLMLDHNNHHHHQPTQNKTSNHKKNLSSISIHSSDSRDFITKL